MTERAALAREDEAMERDVTRSDVAAHRADQTERRTDRARGLMLGLALGESIGLRRDRDNAPTITAGVATQLAAFTLEGYIRAAGGSEYVQARDENWSIRYPGS